MDTGSKGMDPFERQLRESLGQFEVPYNSTDWAQMERALDGNKRGWWVTGAGVSVLVAGLAVMAGGAWYAWDKLGAPEGRTTVADHAVNTAPAGTELPAAHDRTTTGTDASPTDGTEPGTAVGAGTINGHDGPATTITISETAPAIPDPASRSTAGRQDNGAPRTTAERMTQAHTPHPNDGGTPKHGGAVASDDAAFRSSVTEGCPGTSVEFKVSNMSEDGIYLWNFGDGSFSNKANPEHTFTKPGAYQVMLSMSAAGVGSIQNKPSSEMIVIHEAPMAAFNVLKQEYDGHLPSVHFENRSLAGKSYRWDFGDGQTSTIAHPDHIYKKKGVYHVELTVANGTGCEDKLMKDVVVDKDYNLDAPVSFSPNGDSFQETFMPEALRTLGVKFNLQVYASNGTLLYQTTDASKPWTGRPQNRGNLCASGEYVWVADVRESLHLSETYTGKVRLER